MEGALLSRLNHDLAELLESPYPGVYVKIDDANVQKLCLVLTPPSGPWKDLALHFDVELPNHWPSSPPMIYSSVAGITHPNLHGNWICCDLLKEQDELERGYTGGYTPALTLRGLFLQFLTFFSNTKVEQIDGRVVDIGDYHVVHYEFADLTTIPHDQLEDMWNSSTSPETEVRGSGSKSIREKSIYRVKNVHVPMRRVEVVNPKWLTTHKLISQWQCRRCSYNSPKLPVHHVSEPRDASEEDDLLASTPTFFPTTLPCSLEVLDDDVLLELSSHLLSESLVALSTAYPRFRRLITSRYILMERELRCFFLRNPLRSSMLGIGVAINRDDGRLSSDFDWLSWEAFDTYNVRTSVQKRDFEFFLPLAFNRNHFERVEDQIWEHLGVLHKAVQEVRRPSRPRPPRPPKHPHETVEVVYKLMNNIVVLLMQACDDVLETPSTQTTSPINPASAATLLHASEKAVTAYGHLYHLLLCLTRTTPAILEHSIAHLHSFIQRPKYRWKAEVPDLGELIVLITLVLALPASQRGRLSWASMNGPVLEEATVRNAKWLLEKHPTLEVMEDGPSPYRLHTTFMAYKTGLRLMMFQIAFLDIFVRNYAANPDRLHDNYGFPEPDIPARMVEEVKAIYKVNTWPAFFRRVQYKKGMALDETALSRMLRNTIHVSAERKYHHPKKPQTVHRMWVERAELEKQWAKSQPRPNIIYPTHIGLSPLSLS
ncbi:hypothetical protein DXG01_009364 [Tephrocybe rancida]|nr:hypothetical protein DXG01_009364 [Tephrocybe rancida]